MLSLTDPSRWVGVGTHPLPKPPRELVGRGSRILVSAVSHACGFDTTDRCSTTIVVMGTENEIGAEAGEGGGVW